MQIQGNIVKVFEPRSGTSSSGKQWCSLDFVVEVPGQYPRRIALNIFGEERIKALAPKEGEVNVVVDFDIDAHEYNGRWFNDIRAWRAVPATAPAPTAVPAAPAAPAPAASAAPAPAAGQDPFATAAGGGEDDLPF